MCPLHTYELRIQFEYDADNDHQAGWEVDKLIDSTDIPEDVLLTNISLKRKGDPMELSELLSLCALDRENGPFEYIVKLYFEIQAMDDPSARAIANRFISSSPELKEASKTGLFAEGDSSNILKRGK